MTALLKALALLLAAVSTVQVFRTAQVVPKEPSPRVLEAMEKGPHFGEPEEALVGIEVTNQASARTRRSAGLILRCDGFVLCPRSLFTLQEGEKRSDGWHVTVVLKPGTETEKRMAARPPRFTARGLGFTVLKLEDVHLKAARINLPDTLESGDSVEMLSIAWESTAQRFRSLRPRRVSIAEQFKEALSPLTGDVLLKPAQDPIPPGSIILNPDRRVIGMTVSATPAFLSFELLNEATNCVAPSPRTPSRLADGCSTNGQDQDRIEVGAGREMVKVPGGPVRIPRMLHPEQPDMESAAVACMGDFEIDKYEVTNEQYREFWESLPEEQRKDRTIREKLFPLSWAEERAPFPAEVKSLPVLGVSTIGAGAYARWQGKRLPTPYEWARAAYGPRGEEERPEWVKRYVADRQETWAKARAAHVQFFAANAAQFGPELDPPGSGQRRMVSPYLIPWIVAHERSIAISEFSRNVFHELAAGLRARWQEPHKLMDVGLRDYDRSPFGVHDMTLNASELFVPWPGRNLQKGLDRYVQIAWLVAAPRAGDPWTPSFHSAPGKAGRMATGARFPGLRSLGPDSDLALPRLLTRYEQPPHRGYASLESLALGLNLSKTVAMVLPLTGRRTEIGWVRKQPSSLSGFWRSGIRLDRPPPAGYRIWAGIPASHRREIGRDLPRVTPTKWSYRQIGPTFKWNAESHPDFEFLIRVGFRCAR